MAQPIGEYAFTSRDVGCWFDGVRGIYIGELVQELAVAYGLVGAVVGTGDDNYHEATDESIEYLNTLPSPGLAFAFLDGEFFLTPTQSEAF